LDLFGAVFVGAGDDGGGGLLEGVTTMPSASPAPAGRAPAPAAGRGVGKGVRVGMTQAELLRAMGYPYQLGSGQWRYAEPDGRGMSVQFGKDGTVRSVTVGKP